MCSTECLLELVHGFIVFDSGVKKTARDNQYFGLKAAQAGIAKRGVASSGTPRGRARA